METINWKIEGMSCSTCALTIGKYLEEQNVDWNASFTEVGDDSLGAVVEKKTAPVYVPANEEG